MHRPINQGLVGTGLKLVCKHLKILDLVDEAEKSFYAMLEA
jgi:hypothetical protein